MIPPRPEDSALEAKLAELQALPDRAPAHADLLYLRAGVLAALGRIDEARRDYLAVIGLQPDHFGALNDLGALLHGADFRSAARMAYAEAVRLHPGKVIGRINLGNVLLQQGRHDEAHAEFQAALAIAPDHADAHLGMANLLQARGQGDAAQAHRLKSQAGLRIVEQPYRGQGQPCRVLLLVSAAGGNVPTRFLMDDTLFAVWTLPVEAYTADLAPPPHDLVFNAVGDADLAPEALDAAEAVLAHTVAPVINAPAAVRHTGRAANAARLTGLPGVIAPRTATVARGEVAQAAEALGYPVLMRSPGFHTGQYFAKIDAPDQLDAVLGTLPGRELLLIEYLDARGADGLARKYRAMIVGGEIFPLHLAVSQDWKVHYFTADMADRPDHRAQEAAFLADMPGTIGPRAMQGLAAIAGRLGLDYAGVDFGLSATGQVLLFEANATMVVNPPEPDPRWDYRRKPVARILTAVRDMLLARSGRGGELSMNGPA